MLQLQNTFSDGGGGACTVSASSTLKGSLTLLESLQSVVLLDSMDKNRPFLEAAIFLFQ